MSYALAIHGGAGALSPESYTREQISDALSFLEGQLTQAQVSLTKGAAASEVALSLMEAFEDHELFNAGKGSVFNREGLIEMDASFMSSNANEIIAAGISGLKQVKHPSVAAYILAKEDGHALLSGEGAIQYCQDKKLETENVSYFKTTKRWEQHLAYLENREVTLDHGNTVGVAVLDTFGEMVASTSTGGMNGKAAGRVSDSAIIGAGTWADHRTLAISATGTGDDFIRLALCRYTHDLMELKEMSMSESVNIALKLLKESGGQGGFAAVSAKGEAITPYNSLGMFRGSVSDKQALTYGIWD